jgi:hypothetical protein
MNILIEQAGHLDAIVLDGIPYCRGHFKPMIPKQHGGDGYYECPVSGCFQFSNVSEGKQKIEDYLKKMQKLKEYYKTFTKK